jgi:hypothetical protein
VTSVTPSAGAAAGNTAITIAGTGFVAGATVTIGGSAATAVSVAGSTSVTATTPENVPGAASVVVTNPDGQSSTLANGFTYVAGPTVTGVTPNSGPPAGGVQVTITGTGFTLVPTVRFGTGLFDLTTATGVAFINSTQIIATAPAHAAGAVMVIVSNPDGQSALLANAFTYSAPEVPKVTSISANTGGILGGDLITITGSGFVVDSTAVQFGAVPATQVIANATSISVYTPPQAATGPVPVTVTTTTPNGESSVTVPNGFTYVPTVSSVAPRQGYAYGGDDVVITGTGFVAGTTVKFGGDYATDVLNGQPTSVVATTPRHAPGVVDVTVENPDGTSGTLPNTFDYLAPTPLEKADWNVVYIWPGAAAVNHPARLVADVYGRLTGVATLGSETFTTVGYVKGNSVYVTFDVYQDNNPVGSITCSGQFAADSETGNQIIVGTFTATNMGLGGYLGGTATDTCEIY